MSTQKGSYAESKAAEYLKKSGYKIVCRNWRRPDCEIDIVAKHKKTKQLHFFEVKYRESSHQGGGLDYLVRTKIQKMAYAASRYISEHLEEGTYCLSAIEVSGRDYEVTAVITDINPTTTV